MNKLFKKSIIGLTLSTLSFLVFADVVPTVSKSDSLGITKGQTSKMSPSVSNSIDGSPIEVIFTSNLGQLYVGTDRGFAYSFDSKTNKWNKLKHEFDNSSIFALYSDDQNNLYVGTQGGHLYLKSNKSNTWQDITFNLGGKSVWSITGNKNNLYVLSNDLVHYYDKNKSQWRTYPTNKDAVPFSSVLGDSDNNLYAGSINGKTWKFQSVKWVEVGKSISNLNSPIWSILHKNNKLFVGAENGEVYQYNSQDNIWHQLGKSGLAKLDGSRVWNMVLEGNNLYVHTDAGKIFKYQSGKWQNMNYAPHESGVTAWSLNSDSNGNLYVGTRDGVIYRIQLKSLNISELTTKTEG